MSIICFFFFSSRRRHTRLVRDWSSDVCSSDLPAFFFEVVIGGMMTGVMYSLVALGFVLIFKASSVFNFAQGVFALFAAMTLVGLMTGTVPFALDKALPGMPAFVAIVLTGVVMVGLAFLVERVVRSEEHTSELQSRTNLVCRLLLEKKKTK